MIELAGLADHQVVQREGDTGAAVDLTGTSEAAVELRAYELGGRPATGWERAGDGGTWKHRLELPTGGPYELVGREAGGDVVTLVRHVLVGDLWLLAGQSNMQGIGFLDRHVEAPSPQVAVLDMARRWRPAVEPLHKLYTSPDLVHRTTDDPEALAALVEADAASPVGAGLGVAFGNELVAQTGVPVGLIATAHGGTSLAQWSPALRHEGGRSLFGSMLLSIEAAGGRVAGVLWYQGESDALGPEHAAFADRLRDLVGALREELAAPALPFFHVQLGRVVLIPGLDPDTAPAWSAIREVQRTIDLGPGGVSTAVDLPLSDPIHVSTRGLRRLGRRLARLASGAATPLTIEEITKTVTPGTDGAPDAVQVRVRIGGASGPLSPAEHVAGFSLRDAAGHDKGGIFAVTVDGDAPSTVVVHAATTLTDGDSLWYGYGFDPYCNLVDADDAAVPAFGPVALTAS